MAYLPLLGVQFTVSKTRGEDLDKIFLMSCLCLKPVNRRQSHKYVILSCEIVQTLKLLAEYSC